MELHVELGTGWKYQELPSTALLTFVKSEKKSKITPLKIVISFRKNAAFAKDCIK